MSHEPFVVADKFHKGRSTNEIQESILYLCTINKESKDFLEQWMNLLDKKIIYGTLHEIYKKALWKALQIKSSLLRLIKILEDFTNEDSKSEKEEKLDESDKKNDATMFQLQNSKIRRSKERPAGTKRYKKLNEKNLSKKTKQ